MTKQELLERVYVILAAAVANPAFVRERQQAVTEALQLLYSLASGELEVTHEQVA